MSENQNIIERIKILVNKYTEGNSARFARSINIDKSTFNNTVRGRFQPNIKTIINIIKEYEDVDARWLLIGSGKKEYEEKEVKSVINDTPEEKYKTIDSKILEIFSSQLKTKDDQLMEILKKIPNINKHKSTS